MEETLGGFYYLIFGGLIGIGLPALWAIVVGERILSFIYANRFVKIAFIVMIIVSVGALIYSIKDMQSLVIIAVAIPIVLYLFIEIFFPLLFLFVLPFVALTYGIGFLTQDKHILETVQYGFGIFVVGGLLWAYIDKEVFMPSKIREHEENRILDKIAQRFKKDENEKK